jgi:hypothetical protein
MDREQAARNGGLDRQMLREWVHGLNESHPDASWRGTEVSSKLVLLPQSQNGPLRVGLASN